MTAFDTDILSELIDGHPSYLQRLQAVAEADRFVPIVVIEELFRGRLDGFRKAQAGQVKIPVSRAYDLFLESVQGVRGCAALPYSQAAHTLFLGSRSSKIRVGSQDLRIASICIAHDAKFVTRNARDYALVPGLKLEIWT